MRRLLAIPPRSSVIRTNASVLSGGNPAPRAAVETVLGTQIGSQLELGVGRCFIERLPHFSDMRGDMTPLEFGRGLPFAPQRIFLVHGVPSQHVRGEHAHHKCDQFLVAANGSLSVVVDDGTRRQEVRLADQSIGLYLAPMVWGVQYKFSADCVLMVAASHSYEAADYIRDYARYRELVGA